MPSFLVILKSQIHFVDYIFEIHFLYQNCKFHEIFLTDFREDCEGQNAFIKIFPILLKSFESF